MNKDYAYNDYAPAYRTGYENRAKYAGQSDSQGVVVHGRECSATAFTGKTRRCQRCNAYEARQSAGR